MSTKRRETEYGTIAETEHGIIEIISPEVRLGRKQTEEEIQAILDRIARVNYKIAKRLYKEGKLEIKK